ncbi:MAG: type II secretion system protein J [Vulcanimicrobiota bacterium]
MKKVHKKIRGSSLLELLVACVVFSLMVIATFAIIRYCTTNWRGIEDRVVVQTEIKKIQSAVSDKLLTTEFDSVLTYQQDYRHTLAFKTFTDANGNFVTDQFGNPESQGYLLFILLRPENDPCTHENFDNANIYDYDNICPHKILLMVDLTEKPMGVTEPISFTNSSELIDYLPGGKEGYRKKYFNSGGVSLEEYKDDICSTGGNKDYVRNVRIIARNVLSFNVEKAEPEVQVVVKAFKMLGGSYDRKIGTDNLDDSRFTIQVDNHVIPQN